MYTKTCNPHQTRFEFRYPKARAVTLIGDFAGRRWRRELEKDGGVWQTVLDLPIGWFFYAVEVDGRLTWDRDVGKARTADGRNCSLACIN